MREENLVTLGAGCVDRPGRHIRVERIAHVRVDEAEDTGPLRLHPGTVLLERVAQFLGHLQNMLAHLGGHPCPAVQHIGNSGRRDPRGPGDIRCRDAYGADTGLVAGAGWGRHRYYSPVPWPGRYGMVCGPSGSTQTLASGPAAARESMTVRSMSAVCSRCAVASAASLR